MPRILGVIRSMPEYLFACFSWQINLSTPLCSWAWKSAWMFQRICCIHQRPDVGNKFVQTCIANYWKVTNYLHLFYITLMEKMGFYSIQIWKKLSVFKLLLQHFQKKLIRTIFFTIIVSYYYKFYYIMTELSANLSMSSCSHNNVNMR